MATAGVLQLLFTTDASGLSKGIGKARAEVVGFGESVAASGAKIAGLWAGLGAAVTGGGLAMFTKQGMDSANATRILAERLGTSTEGLSRLQYAAKLADVDAETLSGSLEKMQLRLGEIATTGEGKAANVLQRMGLDAATLAQEDPVAAFHEILDVIYKIPEPAERMKTAIDIFGKSASGILNLAMQGTSGIAGMEAEADRLGVTLSDIDAAKIDAADDAMTRIWEAIGGVSRSLATELAPYLEAGANWFASFGQSGVKANSYISQSLDWVTSGVGYILDGVQLMETAWYGLRGGVSQVITWWLRALEALHKGIDGVLEAMGLGSTGMGNFLGQVADNLQSSASQDFRTVGEMWAKPWAHEVARQLVDDVKAESQSNAADAVEKSKLFRAGRGGGIDMEAKSANHFAKAMEFGTAEAANTILRTQFGGSGDKGITAIASNTKRQADAAEEMRDLMRDIAQSSAMSEDEVWSEFQRA